MTFRPCTVAAWIAAVAAVSPPVLSGATPEMIELRCGGRVVARYMPVANPMRPYVKELFTPSGVQLLLDSPADHPHHHGLMLGLGADDTEYYGEKPGAGSRVARFGRQTPRPEATECTPDSIGQTIDWTEPDGTRQLVERRTVRIQACPTGGPNVLTWVTRLEPAEGKGPVALWGRYYFGLGLRPVADLNERARFSVPDGAPPGRKVVFGELRESAAWCAMTGDVGGKPVTVAMWDDPHNQRRTIWFTMAKPMAFLGAALGLPDWDSPDAVRRMFKLNEMETPLTLQPGQELALRYAIAVFDGHVGQETIEKAHNAWLDAEDPSYPEETTP